MTFSDSQRFTARDDLVVEAIDDQIVILDLHGDRCFGLNAQGVLLWQRIREDAPSVAELIELLEKTYAIDAERARADLLAFLSALQNAGLLLEQHPTP
ncbi:PqqD family protein [Lujinxingia vulgaris]|uniref:PqqD family protein n=1 Tax=Lujinxingia vulgaris TaxID=2600176 RepID=A0A5C6X049_9DELT|nr:PqqD family protein [Lujinxingia vulgaris]TXD35107.1 PqqD family protein [Lujinxingia vulgaris]